MAVANALDNDSALDHILARVSEVPVLPHVIFKVMEISGASDSSGAELENAIVIDPGFSAKLLSIANSAYYGLPRKVTSVREAIGFLGFKAIRQLAMTIGVFDVFIGKNDKDSLRRRKWWRHSVDSAVCCRWLARKTGAANPEEAYTAGLLHYLGKTLLDRFGESSYDKVELLVQNGVDDLRSETAVYGCNHVEVIAGAVALWDFPQELSAAIEYTSEPDLDDPHGANRACVALGSKIAELALQGAEEAQQVDDSLPTWALRRLGLHEDKAVELLTEGMREIAEEASIQL